MDYVIEIANDLEWYNDKARGVDDVFFLYHVLHTIGHEFQHYVQMRDKKILSERWADENAAKMVSEHVALLRTHPITPDYAEKMKWLNGPGWFSPEDPNRSTR